MARNDLRSHGKQLVDIRNPKFLEIERRSILESICVCNHLPAIVVAASSVSVLQLNLQSLLQDGLSNGYTDWRPSVKRTARRKRCCTVCTLSSTVIGALNQNNSGVYKTLLIFKRICKRHLVSVTTFAVVCIRSCVSNVTLKSFKLSACWKRQWSRRKDSYQGSKETWFADPHRCTTPFADPHHCTACKSSRA